MYAIKCPIICSLKNATEKKTAKLLKATQKHKLGQQMHGLLKICRSHTTAFKAMHMYNHTMLGSIDTSLVS